MFTYYRYLDKFHTEPLDIRDLFDFIKYNTVDNKISSIIQEDIMRTQEKKHGK